MFDLIGRAHAQLGTTAAPTLNFTNLTGGPGTVIMTLLTWFLTIAGALAVIYLVYGGVLYITAGGDAEKATKGRVAVVNAIIGIIIIVMAVIIVNWVGTLAETGSV